MIKKVIAVLFCSIFFITQYAQATPSEQYVIDAHKNAVTHNNMGVAYEREHCYYPAIKEFKIAIALDPNSSATASYYNNLGNIYLKLKAYKWAIYCYKSAVLINPLFIEYYMNLTKSYKLSRSLDRQLAIWKNLKSNDDMYPFKDIMVGFIYYQKGSKTQAKQCFNRFVSMNPDLIFSKSLKNFADSV